MLSPRESVHLGYTLSTVDNVVFLGGVGLVLVATVLTGALTVVIAAVGIIFAAIATERGRVDHDAVTA